MADVAGLLKDPFAAADTEQADRSVVKLPSHRAGRVGVDAELLSARAMGDHDHTVPCQRRTSEDR